VTAASTDGSATEPPSYDESNSNVAGARTPSMDPTLEGPANGVISRSTSGYFDSATTLVHSTGPSIRFSSELERPQRLSFDDDPYAPRFKTSTSRRGSLTFSETTGITPAITPEAPSPAITPQDESTAARLTRAAARFTGKSGTKSRPTSQAGEGRISITMSRLGLVRPSKEPLRDSNTTGDPDGSEDQAVIIEEEAGGDKEHHHHHHRKDRGKSKSREKDEIKKEKGKAKDSEGKESKTNGIPDRECTVM
jgi:hypothetical protein